MAYYVLSYCINNLRNHWVRVSRVIGYLSDHLDKSLIFNPSFNDRYDYFIKGISDAKFLLNPLGVYAVFC